MHDAPLLIHYEGGPYDGACEYFYADKLGLVPHQGFEIAHLTSKCFHTYRCDFLGEGGDVIVRHVGVRLKERIH
jgi:hypothetical protein